MLTIGSPASEGFPPSNRRRLGHVRITSRWRQYRFVVYVWHTIVASCFMDPPAVRQYIPIQGHLVTSTLLCPFKEQELLLILLPAQQVNQEIFYPLFPPPHLLRKRLWRQQTVIRQTSRRTETWHYILGRVGHSVRALSLLGHTCAVPHRVIYWVSYILPSLRKFKVVYCM